MIDWLKRFLSRVKSTMGKHHEINTRDFPETTHKEWQGILIPKRSATQHNIAQRNISRRRATLGHGLPRRSFKPRPAFEKRLWKLDKKAEDD